MLRLRVVAVSCALVLGSSSALGQTAPSSGSAGGSQPSASADRVPQGLGASDWSGIRRAHEAELHAAFAVAGGYDARNPGQQWLTHFDGRGFSAVPDAGGWTWGLQLERYGFAGAERAVSQPTQVSAVGERVAYDWDADLQEWYVNDSRGLEQGFTVRQRPPQGHEGPLTIALAVRGDLRARIQADGRGAGFANVGGVTVLRYAGLKVFDADGKALAARFEVLAEGLLLTIDERGARYPVTIDPVVQQAYVKASNTDAGDRFGVAVAVSGDTAVVGAPREDSNTISSVGQLDNSNVDSGAAYVFVRNGAIWSQQAMLKGSAALPLFPDNHFGAAVSISGDTILVGAPDKGVLGSAYFFVRSGATWSMQDYVGAGWNAGNFGDAFGTAVCIDGDTAVIGAPLDDSDQTGMWTGGLASSSNDHAPDAGGAYVFVRTGTSWAPAQAYIKPSNPEAGDRFGASVALSGDTIIVGAPNESSGAIGVNGNQADNSASQAGAVYVFERSGSTWVQEAYLKASNTDALDNFGVSVALSANTLVVGAQGEASAAAGVNGNQSSNAAPAAGAAYVFERAGSSWSQHAYLKASNTEAQDGFGGDVAIAGDVIVVGARLEGSNASGIDGDQSNNGASASGAAYLFRRKDSTWSPWSYLKASNPGIQRDFGTAVAVSGGIVFVGADGEASNATGVNGDQADVSAPDAGAAYAFAVPVGAADLTSGTTGSLSSHIFDGTRGVDATVQTTHGLNVTSMSLGGLTLPIFVSGHIAARIYNTSTGALVATSSEVITTDVSAPVTLPIAATLAPGGTYRFAFHVSTTAVGKASAQLFDPAPSGSAGFPYLDDSGWLQVLGATSSPGDMFSGMSSQYVPQIVVNAIADDLDWSGLGNGKVGSFGVPALSGSGPLTSGSVSQLDLTGAKPSTGATLILGLSLLNAPLKGGTLVPAPLTLVALGTNGSGSLSLPFVLPSGLPTGFSLYFQYWITDPAAPHGLSASNGLVGVTP